MAGVLRSKKHGIALDASNNRILVADPSFNAIAAVDLQNGGADYCLGLLRACAWTREFCRAWEEFLRAARYAQRLHDVVVGAYIVSATSDEDAPISANQQ